MQNIKFEIIKKIAETRFKLKDLGKISKIESISPPSVFIGSKLKYPLMNVGVLSPISRDENAEIYDNVKFWVNNNFQISDVLQLRDNLLNSRFKANAIDVRKTHGFLESAKNIAVAYRPVDVEIQLKNKISFNRQIDRVNTAQSIGAPLEKIKLTSNVKIHNKVEKVMNDDLKASEAMQILYKSEINEYSLSKILSIGALGFKKDKKLVPTRWSITATDDILSKKLIENIRNYPWIENYELFFGEFLGNQYLILLIPNIWSYELFEIYFPGSSWNPSKELKASTDFEFYEGRKNYAVNCVGGYYAARLPIVEYLNSIKKQASIFVIRLETPTYWAALGVWVVRESVRQALNNRKFSFSSLEEAKNSIISISKIKFNFDCKEILLKSKLLNLINSQKRLLDWI